MAPAIAFYLGLLIVSFIVTSLVIVPFIDTLYRLKFQRQKQITIDAMGNRSPIFDKFHQHKAGTPVGGGLLVIGVVTFLFAIMFILMTLSGKTIVRVYPLSREIFVIFFTFVSFTNAVNITDGLDGLAAGVLAICLFGFWILSASILDTPLSMFISLWIGSLIAFLYFNVHPARIFLGDVGALAFGASLAVSGLLLGKAIGLIVIGGIFFVEVFTSGVQLLSKRFLGRK